MISSACSDHLSVRAFFRFPPRSPPLRPFRAISYYPTNGFFHLSLAKSVAVCRPDARRYRNKNAANDQQKLTGHGGHADDGKEQSHHGCWFYQASKNDTRCDGTEDDQPITSDARTSSVRRSTRFLLHFFSFSCESNHIHITEAVQSLFFRPRPTKVQSNERPGTHAQ